MVVDSWSKNDYRIFIIFRWDDVFDNWELSVYVFKWFLLVEVSWGDYCEKEVYFDIDVKVLYWEIMVRMVLRKFFNLDQEFEFKFVFVLLVLISLLKIDGDVY